MLLLLVLNRSHTLMSPAYVSVGLQYYLSEFAEFATLDNFTIFLSEAAIVQCFHLEENFHTRKKFQWFIWK